MGWQMWTSAVLPGLQTCILLMAHGPPNNSPNPTRQWLSPPLDTHTQLSMQRLPPRPYAASLCDTSTHVLCSIPKAPYLILYQTTQTVHLFFWCCGFLPTMPLTLPTSEPLGELTHISLILSLTVGLHPTHPIKPTQPTQTNKHPPHLNKPRPNHPLLPKPPNPTNPPHPSNPTHPPTQPTHRACAGCLPAAWPQDCTSRTCRWTAAAVEPPGPWLC